MSQKKKGGKKRLIIAVGTAIGCCSSFLLFLSRIDLNKGAHKYIRIAMAQFPERSERFSFALLALFSGLLLGVSFPTYPFIRLEPIAWIALVPLLLTLRNEHSFWSFFAHVYSTMAVFCLISLWWVSLATLLGGLLTVFVQAFFSTIPLLLFFVVKNSRGYRFALFSLPFLWVSWEWIYIGQELSFGWLVFGNTQALLNPMIQYADTTGVWGVSFWLVCFNVLVTDLWLRVRERKKSVFAIAFVLLAMVLLPLGYSLMVYQSEELQQGRPRVRVALVQPNIDPYEKWKKYSNGDIMAIYFGMTRRVVAQTSPDLIIWPETAIPFYVLDTRNRAYYELLKSEVNGWKSALVSGYSDVVYYADEDVAKEEHLYKYDPDESRYYQTFNAVMLVGTGSREPQVYRKTRLVPFAERVPYMEYAPWLDNLTISLAGITSWGKGHEKTIMEFVTKSGDPVKTSAMICYESIFPDLVAGFAKRGAEFFTLVTNDGWYGKSYGPYQHAAIARFRCIENRRAMVRCANTGVSQFIDRCGRVYADIPWWERRSLAAGVACNEKLTFYTRYPDSVPKVTTAIAAFLLLFSVVKKTRRR